MSAVEERLTGREIEGTTTLPILPLRESVVFPASVTPLAIGQERSIRLVDEAVAERPDDRARHRPLVRGGGHGAEDIHEVGTSAVIHKMIRVPDGTLRILVQGLDRIRLDAVEQTEPYLAGRFTPLPDVVASERRRPEALPARSRRSSAGSSRSPRTCPRSCSSPPPTPRRRAPSPT